MRRYLFAPRAIEDLEAIFSYTLDTFGDRALARYRLLIQRALEDIAENAERPGVRHRSELAEHARTYHLRCSRTHVSREDQVKAPRHLILFRQLSSGDIEVARVLHDSMELSQHLPLPETSS